MIGPKNRGYWSSTQAANCHPTHQFLRAGERYRVIAEFRDYDGHVHPAGEKWEFLGSCFVPYDDGLSLFVSLDGSDEWNIRLQWRDDAQAEILDRLSAFITG